MTRYYGVVDEHGYKQNMRFFHYPYDAHVLFTAAARDKL